MFKLLGHTVKMITRKPAFKSLYPPPFCNEDISFVVIMTSGYAICPNA